MLIGCKPLMSLDCSKSYNYTPTICGGAISPRRFFFFKTVHSSAQGRVSIPSTKHTSEWTSLHSKSPTCRWGFSHTDASFLLFPTKSCCASFRGAPLNVCFHSVHGYLFRPGNTRICALEKQVCFCKPVFSYPRRGRGETNQHFDANSGKMCESADERFAAKRRTVRPNAVFALRPSSGAGIYFFQTTHVVVHAILLFLFLRKRQIFHNGRSVFFYGLRRAIMGAGNAYGIGSNQSPYLLPLSNDAARKLLPCKKMEHGNSTNLEMELELLLFDL